MEPTDPTPYLTTFDLVVSRVYGSPEAFRAIRARIVETPTLLNSPRDLKRVFKEELDQKEWHWPLLSEWRTRFVALGCFPRRWDGGKASDFDLLFQTCLRPSKTQQLSKAGSCVFRAPSSDEPEPIRKLIAELIADYARGDGPGELPPFFPGDVTVVNSWSSRRPPPGRDIVVCAYRTPKP